MCSFVCVVCGWRVSFIIKLVFVFVCLLALLAVLVCFFFAAFICFFEVVFVCLFVGLFEACCLHVVIAGLK